MLLGLPHRLYLLIHTLSLLLRVRNLTIRVLLRLIDLAMNQFLWLKALLPRRWPVILSQ